MRILQSLERYVARGSDRGGDVGDLCLAPQVADAGAAGGEDRPGVAVGVVAGAAAAGAVAAHGAEAGGVDRVEGDRGGGAPADDEVGEAVGRGSMPTLADGVDRSHRRLSVGVAEVE